MRGCDGTWNGAFSPGRHTLGLHLTWRTCGLSSSFLASGRCHPRKRTLSEAKASGSRAVGSFKTGSRYSAFSKRQVRGARRDGNSRWGQLDGLVDLASRMGSVI